MWRIVYFDEYGARDVGDVQYRWIKLIPGEVPTKAFMEFGLNRIT